VELTLHR